MHNFTFGHIYTFDQYLAPPATVFIGGRIETWHIDTAMFAVDLDLIGGTRFDPLKWEADGIFITEV